ncbi:MAG: DUF4129 domain-containing protein [Halobacteriaceae archaeon]
MDREQTRSLAVAALIVLSVALAAAFLSGAIEQGPLQDFGLGNADQTRSPGENTTGGGFVGGTGRSGPSAIFCVTHPLFLWGVPLFILGVGAYLVHRFGYWAGSRISAGFGLLVAIPYALLASCPDSDRGFAPTSDVGNILSRAGAVVPTRSTDPLIIAALTLGAIVLVGVAVRYLANRSAGNGDAGWFTLRTPPRPANPTSDLAGMGEVAGDAADRIAEDADVDNEVYRAWREMTAYLDIDAPRASTPGEFAEAAVAEGLDPDRVDALTDVFERVRYGDADPEAYAEDARAALRAIEEAVAEEDPSNRRN